MTVLLLDEKDTGVWSQSPLGDLAPFCFHLTSVFNGNTGKWIHIVGTETKLLHLETQLRCGPIKLVHLTESQFLLL